jgi:bla regulator protein blaR1
MSIIQHIADPWTHALAWSLLHSIWQVLVIAGLWKFSMWLTQNSPANTRYHISLLALLAIPVTFAITFFQQYGIYKEAERVVLFEFENSAWLNMQQDASFFVIEKNYPAILQNFDNYSSHVFLIYVIGAALISVWFIITYSKLYNLRKRNIIEIPDEWKSLVKQVKQKTGLGDSIRTYLSSTISIPAVVGFFKPVVLFPMAIVGSITIQEVETILLHEYYHIRKKDHYINAIQYMLEILFFYHPCVWWISSSLRKEREKRVDEWVVTQTSEPLLYAKALLTLEENRKMQPQAVMAATNSKNSLLIRIKNFMHMKTSKFNSAQKMAATLVIAGAILSLAWLNPSHMYYYFNDYAASGEGPVWVETPTSTGTTTTTTIQDQPTTRQASPAGNEPKKIYLENGKSLSWDELSDKDKEEIRRAMEEVRLAMQEVNREVFEKLNSEEFRNEMLKVGDEVKKAMQAANTEVIAKVNSDEFRREMEKVREEVRRAMEEVNREFNSEEFRREMQQAQEEIRKAMEEVDRELNSEEFRQEMRKASEEVSRAMQEVQMELNSEEFREEMRKAREEIRKAMQEVDRELNSEEFRQGMQQAGEAMRIAFEQMEHVDWKEFGESMNQIMQEVGKSLEQLSPAIQEGIKNLNFEEMFRSFEYNFEEIPEEEEEEGI